MLDRSLSLLTGRVLLHTSRLTLACLPPSPPSPSCKCRSKQHSALNSAWSHLGSAAAATPHGFATAAAAAGSAGTFPAPHEHHIGSPLLVNRSPLYMRRSLEAMAPTETFKVAGVSFENRQEAVQCMEAGEPVMLTRQPWNAYDPLAVAVYSLRGESLGFVPRVLNSTFQCHELMFGHVEFVGCDHNSNMWGLRVAVKPALMPAYTSACPPQLLPPAQPPQPPGAAAKPKARTRGRKPASAEGAQGAAAPASAAAAAGVSWMEGLSAGVGPERWQQLVAEAQASSNGLCEVTGASAAEAELELVPEWQYNEQSSSVKLQRLSLVCREVALARWALDLAPGSEEQALAITTLVAVNGWTNLPSSDTFCEEQYLDTMRSLRKRLVDEAWSLDLGLQQQ